MTIEEKRLYQNEKMRKWRKDNPEKAKLANKKYRLTPIGKEKHRLSMNEWRKNNPEKALDISRRSYKKNSLKLNEKRKIKYKIDSDYREKKLKSDKKYRLSGKRKEAYNRNPNKKDLLKKRWLRIKNGDYEKVRIKNRKYREDVCIKKERINRNCLNDNYVIMVIKKQFKYKIKTNEIPKELIEAKRNILKIKRINKSITKNK